MARSARRPEARSRGKAARASRVAGLLPAVGRFVFANPVPVGGATAFLVAFTYVSANALWYQSGPHKGAFFQTRLGRVPVVRTVGDGSETTIRIEREADQPPARIVAAPGAVPSELLRRVQQELSRRGIYSGTVDGLDGPQTRRSIEGFRIAAGLEPGKGVDDALTKRLGIAEIAQADQPRPDLDRTPTAAVATPDPVIVQIQAGLRAFGNDSLSLDGVPGSKTRSAIREFQTLFGLPVDGEPNAALLGKMKAVGLVN